MKFELNEKTKKSIEKRIGKSIDEISEMDVEKLDALIEKKIGKKLKHEFSRPPYIVPRGSVFLYLRRLLGIEIINQKLSKI